MPEEASRQQSIESTVETFVVNIKSLRVLNEEIGKRADEHDKALALQKYERMREIFPALRRLSDNGNADEVDNANGQHDAASEGVDADTKHTEEPDDQANEEALLNEVVEEMKESLRDADVRAKLAQFRPLLGRQHPEQGLLLRRGALTTLKSVFDVLVSDLIQTYYMKYPAALPTEAQTLTFSELQELGSVEDARQHLVYKKTDAILREALETQLEFFRKYLKVDLSFLDEDLPMLVEIFQRRNLLVHNNGIVNRQYLTKVSSKLIASYDAKEGEPLATTEKYVSKAIDLVCLAGLLLSQHCWRKWEKESTDKANSTLLDETYESLKEGRLELTVSVARFSQSFNLRNEDSARRIAINHAIALKELGQVDDMNSLLSEKDWSACALPFQLALHALKDEDEAFYRLLPKLVAVGQIEKWHLEQWPLFAPQRATERFAQAVEQNFSGGTGESDGSV